MSFDYAIIGKRLKKTGEEKGYTQEKLAEFLNVSNAYVSKIERGKTTVNLNTLSNICDFLDISPAFVLTGSISTSRDYLRSEITEMIVGCSPGKVKLIAKIIKPIIDYK